MSKTAPAQTSIYLTKEDRNVLDALQARTGLNRSALLRLALRRMLESDEDRQVRLLQISDEIRRLV